MLWGWNRDRESWDGWTDGSFIFREIFTFHFDVYRLMDGIYGVEDEILGIFVSLDNDEILSLSLSLDIPNHRVTLREF